ncbi:sporulation protein YpjB [Bacillus sp. FJAT-42376]|uniref:sporulation protein YpjB n=1 Tax=Bacillus sp. FJAT-42376 TaxID=2014076 RepID=UPI000F50A0A9|nr:sporulation protein YpjB [Bacillus sp. FJAT-42376]AZB43317.1 sporulation protein YpjB [Bacillus sp. FJAT-42376]
MKRFIVYFTILFLLISGTKGKAEETNRWNRLSETSFNAFQLAKQGRTDESLQMLKYFARQFNKQPAARKAVSSQTVRTISAVHGKAIETLEDQDGDQESKMRAITQFHMVVDAAFTENEPLWSSMEASVMSSFDHLKQDTKGGKQVSFEQDWNEFRTLYDTIYPSVSVDVPPGQIRKVEAMIANVESDLSKSLPKAERISQLTEMQTEFKNIFDRVKDDEADPSLLWVIITTGGMIILTLIYAGWRKFKGEKEKQVERERER